MPDMLEINELTKVFGRRTVLDRVSFTVPSGASLAVTGSSGCGKSTLFNILGALEAPTSGSVRLLGEELPTINSRKATKLRRTHINYLFQSYALITDKTAFENALLALHYTPHNRAKKRELIDQVFERLGLGKVKNEKVSTLSGGEQQRLALARCILKPGDLILADEPTGALDAALAERVLDELLNLQVEYGKTLLVVTHDRRVAARCDREITLTPVPQASR